MRRSWLVPGLLLLLAPAPLAAQSYAQQVWDQLQAQYRSIARNSSDWFLRNYVMGTLQKRRMEAWTFSLDKGTSYLIAGVCDDDCQRVDVVLKDADDRIVARREAGDSAPGIAFTPRRDGRYTVEVTMAQCRGDPCFFGFGIFARD